MTPLHIQLLLHYYAVAEPYAKGTPHGDSGAVKEYREQLIRRGLLFVDAGGASGYRTTLIGDMLVKAITSIEIVGLDLELRS